MNNINEPLFNNFKVPPWAGKPITGLHLDVMKDVKLVQKLMIDEKKCYFFGRNKQLCDFTLDHASVSRVHAALVWHRHLNRPFLIDTGSTHGTFIGRIRLERNKPQQVPIDSEIHFGASTRIYIIRERPQQASQFAEDGEKIEGHLLGLPETESEMENLTEFNTAHNRRITQLVEINEVPSTNMRKRARLNVHFGEEEVINPEDIDPTVGRFRNLVQETFIPNKRPRGAFGDGLNADGSANSKAAAGRFGDAKSGGSYHGQTSAHRHFNEDFGAGAGTHDLSTGALSLGAFSVAAKLGLPIPNLAPDVEDELPPRDEIPLPSMSMAHVIRTDDLYGGLSAPRSTPADEQMPRKKKYAKEAWPGKRPGFLVGPT